MNTITLTNLSSFFFSALASLANTTAIIGAGTASSWGEYQPILPKELSR